MDREEKNKSKREISTPFDMRADSDINTDPNGMWTGVSTDDEDDLVVQDVDDL